MTIEKLGQPLNFDKHKDSYGVYPNFKLPFDGPLTQEKFGGQQKTKSKKDIETHML